MRKPRLLDLCCCAGGAARGYMDAGFLVVGVDHKPQPRYVGHAFYQADALEFARNYGYLFDAIHASPPCQGYSKHVQSADSEFAGTAGKSEPRLIPMFREVLRDTRKPFVIENVSGAREHMVEPFTLCGVSFGLPISRHRLFESSLPIEPPRHPKCRGAAVAYAERRGWDYRDMTVTGKGRRRGTSEAVERDPGNRLGHDPARIEGVHTPGLHQVHRGSPETGDRTVKE